jgi:hypothetical protein
VREWTHRLSNYAIFAAALLILAGLQTSLWLQLFGWFPAPQIWLCILVFWVLYREFWESVIMMYLISMIMAPFTSLPFSHLLTLNILNCLALVFIKRRVYWSGATFFMMAAGASVLIFAALSVFLSWRFDARPIRHFAFFQWLLTLLLTMLFALPLHTIFSWLDRLTHKEHPTEAGTGIL